MTRAIIVIALSLALAGPARADKPIELGGFIGAHLFDDQNKLGLPEGADPGRSLSNAFAFGVRMGVLFTSRLLFEGELMLALTDTKNDQADVMALGVRANALYHFTEGGRRKFQPFALVGIGALVSSSNNQDVLRTDLDGEGHLGVGGKVGLGEQWGVRGDLRLLLVPSTASSVTVDWELFVGIYATFPRPKKAPANPDADGDGILGDADKCPDVAETKDGVSDDDGCPEGDTDKDGIDDAVDKCPAAPESKNGYDDTDGCPDEVPKEVAAVAGTIEGITFVTGSAEIEASSHAQLDRAAETLKKHAALRLEIQGHTDDTGEADLNRRLSQERADAVKQYLVGKGIAEARLTAVGHGPDRPVADNGTEEGRAKNRRVDFQISSK